MPGHRIRVWDLPTRTFHWLLAATVVAAWSTGEFGGNAWRDVHFVLGYCVLALLIFRLLWGFAGDRYARFDAFFPFAQRAESRPVGHTRLGALSVYAMLLAIATQAVTGLLSADDFDEGPWARGVSEQTVALMTSIHTTSRWIVLALVTLHVVAIVWYTLVLRKNLVLPMVTGDAELGALPAADDVATRVRALIFAALAVTLIAFLTQR